MTNRTLILAMFSSLVLTACPLREAGHPTKTDAGAPADGETGELACEPELERVKAELAECRATTPK